MPCSLPRPADEAAWGQLLEPDGQYAPHTRSVHGSCDTETHPHAGSWAYLHTYTENTHAPALVHKCSYPRVALRATHAQKQHKHPDTPTLVHLHSQALETHILPL